MAESAKFTVTDHHAPRLAVAPDIKDMAHRIAADAAANTPVLTGRMAGAYVVEQGDDPATSIVRNPTPYARFVEYGTRYEPAQAPLGRAIARARGSG
jgi:hypothetical protein